MKPNHLKFLIFSAMGAAILFLLPVGAVGQNLSRQAYQVQLHQALAGKNIPDIQELLKRQRTEAIRYIETLLDSGVIKQAAGDIEQGLADWRTTKELSGYYREIFGDDFYLKKTDRFLKFNPNDLKKKKQIISLKDSCRQDFYHGNFQDALANYEKALHLGKEIGDIDETAALLGNIGACYFYLGDFDMARDYYQRSLKILQEIGDLRRIGNRLGNIASVYNDKSDYPKAISYYKNAIDIRRELNDRRGLAADYNNLGLVHEEMGAYQLAITYYQKALEINREIENDRGVGKNLANLANVEINLGDYLKALEIYEQAIILRREQGDRKGEGNDLGNMGVIYLSLGDYPQARNCYEEALSIHRELGFKEGEAYQLGRLAEMYFYQGEYARAIETYQEALAIHGEMGHVHGETGWLEALGEVYLAVGDPNRSIETLQLALEKHRSIGNRPGEANTLTRLGNVYLTTEKHDQAKACFQQAMEIFVDLGEKWGHCVCHANLAYLESLRGRGKTAITGWSEALTLANELGEIRLQAWLQLQLGDFYRMQNSMEPSAKAYEQGLAILEELNDPELRWQLYYGQGELWKKKKDDERAYYSYRAAVNAIEEIRGSARISELKAGIIHNRFDAYEAIITLLVKMDRVEEAFQFVERARSRSLLDMMGNGKIRSSINRTPEQIAEEQALRAKMEQLFRQVIEETEKQPETIRGAALETYKKSLQDVQKAYQRLLIDLKIKNPEYAAMVSVEPVKLTDIQRLLPEETAILEYLVTEESTIIFIMDKQNLNVVKVPEGYDNIRGKITLFQGTTVRNMNARKLSEQYWIEPMSGLYQILIDPAIDNGYLENKKQIIIVPQGLLHTLPFQALVTGYDDNPNGEKIPHFLVEDYTISYMPSASLLKFCRDKHIGRNDASLLMAPRVNHLPMSGREVKNIAGILGSGAEFYLNEEATESRVKQQGKRYTILHFATTAYFNHNNPLFSRLMLAGCEQEDGNLEVYEIYGLDLHADLVGLSACQTGLGSGYTESMPRGDDLISLSRAFIYAGSHSVVASLWEVADPSTALMMEKFYENRKTMNKAEALTLAQREMVHGNYAHPYYWAPFIMVGDWE